MKQTLYATSAAILRAALKKVYFKEQKPKNEQCLSKRSNREDGFLKSRIETYTIQGKHSKASPR
jgi:hypothetical protein